MASQAPAALQTAQTKIFVSHRCGNNSSRLERTERGLPRTRCVRVQVAAVASTNCTASSSSRERQAFGPDRPPVAQAWSDTLLCHSDIRGYIWEVQKCRERTKKIMFLGQNFGRESEKQRLTEKAGVKTSEKLLGKLRAWCSHHPTCIAPVHHQRFPIRFGVC